MRRSLAVLAGVCVLVPLARAHAAPTPNLLVDPGAEAGLYDAWTTENEFVYEAYGAANRPSVSVGQAIDGGVNVFAGGGKQDAPASSATQTVDVGGRAALIDAGGEVAALSGYLGGLEAEKDHATVTATFLPGGSSVVIGPVTAADRGNQTKLLARSATAPVPAGTRSIRVVVTATRVDGIYTDGYADNLSLTLDTKPSATPTPGPNPTPTPTATATPTPAPTTTRRKGSVRGIKSPGRRIKGKIAVAGATCKSGRRIVVKKGSKTVGSGRTKSSGAFNIKTKKHKKGKLTVKIRQKTTSATVCAAVTKRVPGRN